MKDTIKKAIKDFRAGKRLPEYRSVVNGTGLGQLTDTRWSWFCWTASHGSSPGDAWWTYRVYNKWDPDETVEYGVIRHKPAACPKETTGITSVRSDGTVDPWGLCDACEYYDEEGPGGSKCTEPKSHDSSMGALADVE